MGLALAEYCIKGNVLCEILFDKNINGTKHLNIDKYNLYIRQKLHMEKLLFLYLHNLILNAKFRKTMIL